MTMNRFVIPVLITTSLGVVTVGTIAVGAQGPSLLVAAPLALTGLGWMLFRGLSGHALELRWASTPRALDVPLSSPTPPAATPRPTLPTGPPPATRRQVTAALARVEARLWLSSPWFGVGLGFCVLLALLFGWVFTADTDGLDGSWRDWFVLLPIMAHPLVGMVVIGAHHAVTRGRRSGADELFATCPVDDASRTVAHLRSSWVPALTMAAFVVAATASVARNSPDVYGPIDGRALADTLTALALVVGGVGLGVALGRWAPWTLAPVVAVPALAPLILGLGALGEPHWSNLRQLSTWPRFPDHDLLFTAPRVWWHLLWIVGLAAVTSAIAFAHARRDRPVVIVAAALAVATMVAGVAQSLPLSGDDAARLASLVAEPHRHQTCRSDRGAEVCAYRGYEDYLDRALAHAAPVVAAVPTDIGPVTFRQGFDGDVSVLGPEVGRELERLASNGAAPADHLPLGYSTTEEGMVAVRMTAALHAVGLPVRATPPGVPLVIAGQARGVVALWLAARGLPFEEALRLAQHHYNPDDDTDDRTPTALDLGMAWPDPCISGPPPVAWSAQDLAAARALLALPDERVHRLLQARWDQLTDPATATDQLLVVAGLEPIGPPDHVDALPVTCSY